MRFLKLIPIVLMFGVAALFILAVGGAMLACPPGKCVGPDLDAWMPAFLFAPLGAPSAVGCVVFVAGRIWPNSRIITRVGVGLGCAVLAVIGAVVIYGAAAGTRGGGGLQIQHFR
jgi:hypothetical protein